MRRRSIFRGQTAGVSPGLAPFTRLRSDNLPRPFWLPYRRRGTAAFLCICAPGVVAGGCSEQGTDASRPAKQISISIIAICLANGDSHSRKGQLPRPPVETGVCYGKPAEARFACGAIHPFCSAFQCTLPVRRGFQSSPSLTYALFARSGFTPDLMALAQAEGILLVGQV